MIAQLVECVDVCRRLVLKRPYLISPIGVMLWLISTDPDERERQIDEARAGRT